MPELPLQAPSSRSPTFVEIVIHDELREHEGLVRAAFPCIASLSDLHSYTFKQETPDNFVKPNF